MLYQIYPRSFADSDGDGVGDLPGIIEHLDHLQWLGVDGIWLSPVTVSPNADWGYDVADYLAIDPELGTLDDVDRLIAEAGRRDIRVMMDLVPNHTSEQHPWFVDSRSSPTARPPELVRLGRSEARRLASQQLGLELRRAGLDARRGHRPVLPPQPPAPAARPQLVGRRGPGRLRRHHGVLARPGGGRLPHRRVQHDHQGRPAAGQPARPPRTDPFDEQLFGQRSVYNANRPEVHEVIRRWRRAGRRVPGERAGGRDAGASRWTRWPRTTARAGTSCTWPSTSRSSARRSKAEAMRDHRRGHRSGPARRGLAGVDRVEPRHVPVRHPLGRR